MSMRWRELPLAACLATLMPASMVLAVPTSAPSVASPSIPAPLAPGYAPLAFAGLTLQQAQNDAVAQSPDVDIARANVDAASANLTAARAGFGPSLIAGYTQNPQAGATPGATVQQQALNLGVQTTLLSFAQFLPLLSQAEATYRVARANAVTAERHARIRAATLYFNALRARASLSARREAFNLALAQQQAAQRRFKSGEAPRIDVVRADVAAAQALAALDNAQASDANAAQALALETGLSATSIGDPVAGSVPAGPAAPSDPDSAVQRAMSQRKEIASARDNVAAASAGVNAARVGVLPAITLSAGYEHGIDTGQAVKGPTLTASFELPFNSASASRISQASALLAQARAQFRAAQRQLTVEVSSAVRTLNASIQATAAFTRARQAAQEELNATFIGYRTGASSSLERTAASATYADARLAELSAIYDEALARTVVALELGP